MSERRINWAPFIPILLIALGSLILLGVLGYGYYQFILSNPNSAPLPETIIEFPLQRHAFGAQAVEEINNLHNLKFPLSSGAVAVYGSQGKVTLWVSGAPTKWMAKRLTSDMEARIAEGNSPFNPIGARNDGSRAIYELDGLGQKHFYFQSNNLLIWVAADHEIAENVLSEILLFYP